MEETERLPGEKAEAALGEKIWNRLREGFDGDEEIVEGALEYLAGEIDPDASEPLAKRILTEALAALRVDMSRWPEVTDCDRLDAAFEELERNGIVARSNFTCCSNCGEAEIGEELEEASARGVAVRGYTFYHQQDTEHAVAGAGVMLKYGPSPYDTKQAVPIGREIQETVERHGLKTEWNGSEDQCVHVLLDWKRRRRR